MKLIMNINKIQQAIENGDYEYYKNVIKPYFEQFKEPRKFSMGNPIFSIGSFEDSNL